VASEFAAIVLAGGRGRRLGGVDKLSLRVEGRSLLARTVDAVSGASCVVVVGPRRSVDVEVIWTRESPPGGGPLAALEAGLTALPSTTGLVAVLAADHPYLTSGTVQRLVAAVSAKPQARGAVLTDDSGRAQWLVGVWQLGPLRDRMPGEVRQRPVRRVLAELGPVLVPAIGAEASDVDTPGDWQRVAGAEAGVD
jgi:molybdopterin-guanine dinucleotide biosynthesis protein A